MVARSISVRSRHRTRLIAALVLGSSALFLARPAPAPAVTLGSDLSKPPIGSWGCGGMPCDGLQLALPGATTVSPVNGTIKTFRIRGASGVDTGRLRVVTPNGGGTSYTFKATSATVTVPAGDVLSTFTTSLPISKGDLVALEDDHFDGENFVFAGGNSGGYLIFQPPPLSAPVIPAFNLVGELLYNADVTPTAIFPKPKKPKPGSGGTVLLTIAAPNPGLLSVLSSNAKGASAAAKGQFVKPVSKDVAAAGNVKVKLRPTKSTKSILRRFGQANGQVRITFTPTGGSPSSRSQKIRLQL